MFLFLYHLFFKKNTDQDLSQNIETMPEYTDTIEENNDKKENISVKNERGYFVSENYKISDIQFGGSSPLLVYGNQNLDLDIYNIESKVLADPNKKQINLLISWKTNKLASSEIEYYPKNKLSEKKTIKEVDFGFNHNVAISDLKASTVYMYKIKCRDNWGKEAVSENRIVYTGKGFVSIFDVISDAFGDMFSWASR